MNMKTQHIKKVRQPLLKRRSLKQIYFLICMAIVPFSGCKKFIEVDPPGTFTNATVVFSDNGTATAVLTGVYIKLSYDPFNTGVTSLSVLPELSGDNLITTANDVQYLGYYQNALDAQYSGSSTNYWNEIYPIIYTLNSAIEGLNQSNSLSPNVKQQLLGESHFMRAFCYFYLTNLFGDIPLVLSSDYLINSQLSKNKSSDVYAQIISDLKTAEGLLHEDYLDISLKTSTLDRVRPNKASATALLARVYLYNKQYDLAEATASLVIQNGKYKLIALSDVFLKNSMETIWALQPVTAGENTKAARFYVLPNTGPNESAQPTYLSNFLLTQFETNDQRRQQWISQVTVDGKTYAYSAKYKVILQDAPVSEFPIVLRLSEQFLIRSEARAQQNKLNEAKDDLNSIRNRAGLANSLASSKEEILTAILKEKQVELFTEWGHRWFDLKRSGKINEVMAVVAPTKKGTWNSNWQLYPIPQSEIDKNKKLIQNPGY